MRKRLRVAGAATMAATMLALVLVLAAPSPVAAYLGPGGVVSGLGALLALVGAVFASLFGFVWFPVKGLLRRLRAGSDEHPGETSSPQETLVE